MKVTLDIGRLLATNEITQDEHDRLLTLAKRQSSKHVWGVLAVMGATAVALGVVGLFPEFARTVLDGLVHLYGVVFAVFGRQGLHVTGFLALIAAGAVARSGFLVGLSCFVVVSFLGGTTGYSHASYWVAIEEPAVTVLAFSLLALVSFFWSLRLPTEYERLALIFSRTCLIFVNLAFWVGSPWGSPSPVGDIHALVFTIVWAVGLLAGMLWAAKVGRLWVVNVSISFGVIHFYTQLYERLGASPATLLLGGLAMIGIVVAARRYGRHVRGESDAVAGSVA